MPHTHTLAGFGLSDDSEHLLLFDVRSSGLIPLIAKSQTGPDPRTPAFSPDGTVLAVGCGDNTIRIHAASNDWRQVKGLTTPNHTAWVGSVAFSRDGQWMASAGGEHGIRVWRTRDWQETANLCGHEEEVWTVAFTPDGQCLVSGSKDHTVRLWPLTGRSKPVEEASVSGEGVQFVGLSGVCPFSMGPSNVLTIWDGQTLRVRQRISSYPVSNVVDCRPSPDGRLLLMATAEAGLWLTDLTPGAVSPPGCLQKQGLQVRDRILRPGQVGGCL